MSLLIHCSFFSKPPFVVQAVLLPYRDVIVYDALAEQRMHLMFGPGIRNSFNESYRLSKELGRFHKSL